jgi:hypothetical protein
MAAISEHAELMGYLRGKAGQDLLAALPLISANIETTSVLHILRASFDAVAGEAKKVIKRPFCVVAFGSLGRREYVSGVSDLDPIIIVRGSVSATLRAKVRSAILAPIVATNPWLPFDHRAHIIANQWQQIADANVPYPVIGTDELLSKQAKGLTKQRQWQVLLESRPLLNSDFFNEVYDALLPQIDRHGRRDIDFQQLSTSAGVFFGSFDNPLFLYKSPFKFFKTRFLRDFFIFGTQLAFLIGHYLQRAGERLHTKYVRAATVNKMMRALRFAEQLDFECAGNASLCEVYEGEITAVLTSHGLHRPPLLQFGADQYRTAPARYLHGLLLSVLSRFSACWEQIYDPHVRAVLETIPKSVSVDSVFPQAVTDEQAVAVLMDLRDRRESYRKYMSATATVIRDVFPRGRTWSMATVPRWISDSLEPFIRPGASGGS